MVRISRAHLVNGETAMPSIVQFIGRGGWLAAAAFVFASVAQPAPASAEQIAGVPDSGRLEYDVIRKGDEIGAHIIAFSRRDGALNVDIATDVRVAMPIVDITLYEFEHAGHETWRDGHLTGLDSKTNDDGTPHVLHVAEAGPALAVESDGANHASASDILPASLWNPAIRNASVLLNTLDGREMTVTAESLGMETIEARGQQVLAEHVRLSGDLERDLWYSPDGLLVGVRFKGSDGSEVAYVLR